MSADDDSLRVWLLTEIRSVLGCQAAAPPLLLWCGPDRERLELASDSFELRADQNTSELLTRDRFHHAPRVVSWSLAPRRAAISTRNQTLTC